MGVFTVATAISRLTGSGHNAFPATFDAGKQLQRVNEVLERFYEFGTWRGLHATVPLTTSGGILTLDAAYQRIDGLAVPAQAMDVPIRSMQWAFSTGGPGNRDWTTYLNLVAIDQGDVGGQRKYQLTGNPTAVDAMAFNGLARRRFAWITDTATVVVPDSFPALKCGVQAMQWEDEGDDGRYQAEFGKALQLLNGNLEEFQPDMKQIVIQRSFSPRRLNQVH